MNNQCSITRFFPTLEDLKKEFSINLDSQEVTRLSSNKIYKKRLLITNKEKDEKYYYVSSSLNGRRFNFRLHRLLFYWKYGYLPEIVDHIDRNSLNNNIDNLRELNTMESARNTRKFRNGKRIFSSKYKGVSIWRSSKNAKKIWRARLLIPKNHPNYNNPKQFEIFLGIFLTEDEAGQAYNDKIRELGLEEVSVLNDTPQERARKINLFNEEKKSSYS